MKKGCTPCEKEGVFCMKKEHIPCEKGGIFCEKAVVFTAFCTVSDPPFTTYGCMAFLI